MHEHQIRDYLYGFIWLSSDIRKLQSYNAYLTDLHIAPWYVEASRKKIAEMKKIQKAVKIFFHTISRDDPVRQFIVEKYMYKDKDKKIQSLDTILKKMTCDEATYWRYDYEGIKCIQQIVEKI